MTEEKEKKNLWKKAKNKSKILRKDRYPENFGEEMKKIRGGTNLCKLNTEEGWNDTGFVSIWLALACLNRSIKDLRKNLEQAKRWLRDNVKPLVRYRDELFELAQSQKAKKKGISKKKLEIAKLKRENLMNKDIAQKVGVSEAYVSKVLKQLKEKGVK